MNTIDLNGNWMLQFGPQTEAASKMGDPEIPEEWTKLTAMVPGNVELDLMDAGMLPKDLEMGSNIYELRKFETYQWWYSRTFQFEEVAESGAWELVMDGVDTLATIWVNGAKVASLANMFIPHRLEVAKYLRKGENHVVIGFDSVVLAAAEKDIEPGTWAMENNWESLSIRKAAHGFGWDISPRVMSVGLWKSIRLENPAPERFRSVYISTLRTDPAERTATFAACWDIEATGWPIDDSTVSLQVVGASSGNLLFEIFFPVLSFHGQAICELENVDLWWPRGSGSACLYEIHLTLIGGDGQTRAERSTLYGFRTIELDYTETTNKEGEGKFDFIVNGVRIFVKGTNWVPLDAIHSRDQEHLDGALEMLSDLNCNMIRCWGGNVYESKDFFDYCDAHGIMVWQDFSFACALYPQTPEFHEQVRNEAAAIIPLLRNHTSLALWAGNNEIDAFYTFAKPMCNPNEDDQISRKILSSACRHFDPNRTYLPSSPYFGEKLWAMGALHEARPEDHLWGPRNDFKGEYYLSSNAHFVSEIGYHGCPDLKTMKQIIRPENLWPRQGNEDWLTHAVRPQERGETYNFRIELMANQIKVLFGEVPENLEDFIFASQVSQAEALKFFIERFRCNKERYSGIIWWNLRDGWPMISDAVVDYYGRKKLAYDVIKRVQADVCVMLGEPHDGCHDIIITNDTLSPIEASAKVSNGSDVLFEEKVTVSSNGCSKIGKVSVSEEAAFYVIEWTVGEQGHVNHYLAGPRPFDVARYREWYGSVAADSSLGNDVS